jgi:hypothetical protein
MVCTGVGLAGSLWAGTHAQVPPYTFVVVVCNRLGVAVTDPLKYRSIIFIPMSRVAPDSPIYL